MARFCIFTGRFQPFHNGHLATIKEALTELGRDDQLVIGVICNIDESGIKSQNKNALAKLSDVHGSPTKNPWPPSTVLGAVQIACERLNLEREGPPILVTLMPRPSYYLNEIKRWFPRERLWLIPDNSDHFDDEKALFFLLNNEEVMRVGTSRITSGTDVRLLFETANKKEIESLMPNELVDIYWNEFIINSQR